MSDWVTGAFALGGAFVGALASFGGTAYVEWRRDGRAEKIALRVLREELIDCRHGVRVIDHVQNWVPVDVATPAWERQREITAASLSKPDWKLLTDAYDRIRWVQISLRSDADPNVPKEVSDLDARDAAYLKDSLRVIDMCTNRLEQIAG